MKKPAIHECYLDQHNKFMLESGAVGDLIRKGGGEMLWSDRAGSVIDTVVLHYISAVAVDPTQAFTFSRILGIFCEYGVSSHYLITRRGKIFALVPEERKAWHCGGSIMPEPDLRTGVNEFSIGVELVATADSGFTLSQYRSLAILGRDIESRRGKIKYCGHEDVAGERAVALGLRSERKPDPGPLFNWVLFHRLKAERQ